MLKPTPSNEKDLKLLPPFSKVTNSKVHNNETKAVKSYWI